MERLELRPCHAMFGYETSLDGTVIFRKKDKITYLKKVVLNNSGVEYVRAKRFGERKYIKVAEMVALAFIPKRKGDILYCRNGNWNDYSLDNLYWENPRTLPENCNKIWRVVKQFPNKYEVSEDGEVRQYKTCEPLAIKEMAGHYYVKFYSGKKNTDEEQPKTSYYSVAVLVAEAFIENPRNYKFVGHIDGNTKNNHYTNLVWGKRDNIKSSVSRRPGVKVDEYLLDGSFVGTWDTMTRASIVHQINAQDIRACCNGKHITAAGRVWRWHGESFSTHRTPPAIKLRPGEYFKHYPGTDAEVSNYGMVRNYKTGRIYMRHEGGVIRLTKDGKTISKKMAVMVAELFLPNPKGYKRVTFRDGNSNNTYVGNLKWVRDMECL